MILNKQTRHFSTGDIITVAGEDFMVEGNCSRLRNIRNLRQLEDITLLTRWAYGPVKQR